MGRKKQAYIFFASLITIILIVLGLFFIYRRVITNNIRKTLLTFLERRLEFCEISKEEISIKGEGKFWLMCNGRPFFAEYDKGNISYELNGWGWIQEEKEWDKLKECDFYDFRDSRLIFYCPDIEEEYPYFWKSARGEIYLFNKEDFSLEKVEEKNFFDLVSEDVKNSYPALKDCEVSKVQAKGGKGYKPIFLFEFKCDNLKLVTETNLHFSFPPIDFDNPTESLQKVFPQIIEVSVKDNEICAKFQRVDVCLSPRMTMKIFFRDEIKKALRDVSFIIFPKREVKEVSFIKEEKLDTQEMLPKEFRDIKFKYFKVENEVIKVMMDEQTIFGLERLGKNFTNYEKF